MSALALRGAPLAIVLCLFGGGCAQNALFELYVQVPQPVMIEGTGRQAMFARVLALPAITGRDTTFDGSRTRIVALEPGATRWLGLTLARDPGFTDAGLTVRIVYCETEDDCDPVQPERWAGFEDLVFERAFYVGRTTCYSHALSDSNLMDGLTLPAAQRRVSTCEVAGCADDDFSEETADFCRLGGTTHFCAAGQSGDVCDRLHRDLLPLLAP